MRVCAVVACMLQVIKNKGKCRQHGQAGRGRFAVLAGSAGALLSGVQSL